MPPVSDQPITTYSDTAAVQKLISDWIFNIDPMDTPVVARMGYNALEKFKMVTATRDNKGNTKIELLEDTYEALSTTANHTTTISTSTLSFKVTDASLFNPGDILLIDSEKMVVADGGVNLSTDIITVDSRAYGGTNATHASNSTIYFVGSARVEGDDADYPGLTQLSNVYNYTSIFQKGIKVTGSENQMAQYGKPGGEYEYQMNKVIPEMARRLERAFFYSVRRIGTESQARSMGGIGTFVTTIPTASNISTTITKAALEAASLSVFNAGGVPDLLILPAAGAANLRAVLDTSSFVNLTQENTIFGMRRITAFNTQQFENIEIMVSRHCPAKQGWLVDSSKIALYPYRDFAEYPVARTGDSMKGEVIGEFSLLVANGATGHAQIVTSNSTGL